MPAKQIPYVHEDTGNVVVTTKQAAKKLPPEYKRVLFTTNEKGERVMRLNLRNAVVDVSANGEQEVVSDGIGSSE